MKRDMSILNVLRLKQKDSPIGEAFKLNECLCFKINQKIKKLKNTTSYKNGERISVVLNLHKDILNNIYTYIQIEDYLSRDINIKQMELPISLLEYAFYLKILELEKGVAYAKFTSDSNYYNYGNGINVLRSNVESHTVIEFKNIFEKHYTDVRAINKSYGYLKAKRFNS